MAEITPKKNNAGVKEFLHSIEHENKRKDYFAIAEIMKKEFKAQAKMWGTSIIGFGNYHLLNMHRSMKVTCVLSAFPTETKYFSISLWRCERTKTFARKTWEI